MWLIINKFTTIDELYHLHHYLFTQHYKTCSYASKSSVFFLPDMIHLLIPVSGWTRQHFPSISVLGGASHQPICMKQILSADGKTACILLRSGIPAVTYMIQWSLEWGHMSSETGRTVTATKLLWVFLEANQGNQDDNDCSLQNETDINK